MSLANLSYVNECSAIYTNMSDIKPEYVMFFCIMTAVFMVYFAAMNAVYLLSMELNKHERTNKINIHLMENLLKRQNDLEKSLMLSEAALSLQQLHNPNERTYLQYAKRVDGLREKVKSAHDSK